MSTGFSECPNRLQITVPLVKPDSIKYIPWNTATHQEHLQLNYDDLKIPEPLKLKKSTIKMLDQMYKLLDSQLTQQIAVVCKKIVKIKDARMLTAADVCAYVAVSLAVVNSMAVFLVMLCR